MCGRFSLGIDKQLILERFDVMPEDLEWSPRYNVAPTQILPAIITEQKQRHLKPMLWGLIPHWNQSKKMPYPMINARAETLHSKPTFRELFKMQRCLIPSDGFYEWKKTGSEKKPFRICLKSEKLFGFAGIWDVWQNPEGNEVRSFSILTVAAHPLLSQIHDRMPLILPKESEEEWLNPDLQDPVKLEKLFLPRSQDEMKIYEISSLVNSWKNDSPECFHAV